MKRTQEESLEGLSDPRVLFAAERTLLAWVRTGLAMMGIGFVVARFGLSLDDVSTGHGQSLPPSPRYSVWIGAALILLGVIAQILSAVQHVRTLSRLKRGQQCHRSPWPLSLIITGLLAALGLFMALYLIVSAK